MKFLLTQISVLLSKKFFGFTFFLLLNLIAKAQSPIADKLKDLQNAQHDTTRFKCYIDLAAAYMNINLDSMSWFLQQATPLSKNYPNHNTTIRYYNSYGNYWRYKDNFDTALSFYNKALVLATSLKNDFYIKGVRFNKTELLRLKGSNHLAVQELLTLEQLLDKKKDSTIQKVIFSGLVSNYNDLKKSDKAMYYAQKLLEYARNKVDSVTYYVAISSINTNNDSLLSSLNQQKIKLFPTYFALAKELEDTDNQQLILANLGNSYMDLKQYDKALEVNNLAWSISEKKGAIDRKPQILQTFGRIYYFMKQYPKSLEYLKKSAEGFEKTDKGGYIRALRYMSDTYAALGDYKNAYNNHVDATELQNELSGIQRQQMVAELETQYELREKERQITEKELENRLQQERLTIELRQKYVYIGLFSLATILFIWAIRNYRLKSKLSDTLGIKKAELEEKTQQLTHLNDVKDKLFTIVAHDLKQPALAFQKLGVTIHQLIKKKDIERLEKVGKYAESMSNNLHLTIENLFRWGTLQQQQVMIQKTDVDINALLNDLYEEFEPIAEAKKIDLTAEIPKNCHLITDRSILTIVLRNILSNAIKFTPKEKDIKLVANMTPQYLTIQVNDSGIGIPETMQKSLFVFNPDKKREGTSNEHGSGLGLSLCKELSKLAEIHLTFISQENQGSSFIITCPV